jgi:hypothetical protein
LVAIDLYIDITYYNSIKMPPTKRYAGTLNCHIPGPVRRGIMEVARLEGMNKSEAVRELLETGLRARGIECQKI